MMKKAWLLLLIFGLLALTSLAAGKKAYEIRLTISDLKDTTVFLANYYGERTYLRDTTELDSKGRGVFTGEEALEEGIYIIALGKTRLFEFLVDGSQFFSLETHGPEYISPMKIKDSPENQWFFDYLHYNSAKYLEAEPLQKRLSQLKDQKDSAAVINSKLDQINKEVEEYKLNFMKEHPKAFMTSFFSALKEPVLPEAPLKPDGKRDSAFLYYYYRQHYWDNINLLDDRLLRTPFFHNKIVTYFDKLIIQVPDSIILAADDLISRAKDNKEMFKYFVWYLTNTYEISNVMGFDEIFVHMVETYYMTNQAYWVNPTVLDNLIKKAQKLKPILIGKTAPNMIMLDTNLRPASMYAIPAKYTILYFWDPDCGHCKTETPKLKKFYSDMKEKYSVEVFGVCSDTSMAEMKAYIRKNDLPWINVNGPRSLTPNYHNEYDISSTPVVYLLDEKKTILAKRLLTDQLEKFIERHESLKK